jgi:hypothetical protein
MALQTTAPARATAITRPRRQTPDSPPTASAEQITASAAQRIAASAQQLSSNADTLNELVAQFKVLG